MEKFPRIKVKGDKEFEVILNEEDKKKPVPLGHRLLTPETREEIKNALNTAIRQLTLTSDDLCLEESYEDTDGILMRRYRVVKPTIPFPELIITYRAHAVINGLVSMPSIWAEAQIDGERVKTDLAWKKIPRGGVWIYANTY